MAYDRADWHYGGDSPEDLPPENGATHIGMFLGWAIKRGLVGDRLEASRDAIASVRAGQVGGRDILMQLCDEKLVEADLNAEGKRFADAYYSEHYINDYSECLDSDLPSLYHVADSAQNWAKMEAVLDRRFEAWRRGSATVKNPQWTGEVRSSAPSPSKHNEPRTSRKPQSKPKPWWRFW